MSAGFPRARSNSYKSLNIPRPRAVLPEPGAMPVNLAAQRSRAKVVSRTSMNTQARPRHPAQLEQVGYQQLRTLRRTAMQLCLCCLSASLALLSLPTVPSQTHGQPASSGVCTHRPWPHPKLSLQKLHLKPLAGLSSSQRNAVRTLQGRLRCPAAGPARRLHTLHTHQQTPIGSRALRAC